LGKRFPDDSQPETTTTGMFRRIASWAFAARNWRPLSTGVDMSRTVRVGKRGTFFKISRARWPFAPAASHSHSFRVTVTASPAAQDCRLPDELLKNSLVTTMHYDAPISSEVITEPNRSQETLTILADSVVVPRPLPRGQSLMMTL
jgi:hypothetical protein